MDTDLQDQTVDELEEDFQDIDDGQENDVSKNSLGKSKSADEKRCENELLGSVTTVNSPGVRTSARVIQKMKQDQTRPSTPPPDKRENSREDKSLQKTPGQMKSSKVVWSNTEKNLFFDALNEFGRDFESIANFINSKLKRKSSSDQGFKSKEHVRQSFYQTFHKISKFIKFSDEVKKPAQELYALINYGEMRRRLSFVSEKNLMKIKDLIYKGHATLRSKGKTVRIKTPSCKALRKLNELEDWLEDIKLPSKVEICLRPATMESWGRVQSIAQNPVVRTVVPLQKKLSTIIRTFQYRWRSHETKINEDALKLIGTSFICDSGKNEIPFNADNNDCDNLQEPLICFTPHQDATIHRPLVSITELLSSFNICLNAYEERIGVKVRGEMLCHEKHTAKRQRSDSGCEKKSPEHKKFRTDCDRPIDSECNLREERQDFGDILNSDVLCDIFQDPIIDDKINPFERQDSSDLDSYLKNDYGDTDTLKLSDKEPYLSDSSNKLLDSSKMSESQRQKKKEIKYPPRKKEKKDTVVNHLKPLINEDVLKQIRKGWTILNCGDITIGDLYVAFGQDSKLMFEYSWLSNNKELGTDPEDKSIYIANNNEVEDSEIVKQIHRSSIGSKLKQLLLIAHLSENVRRKPCYCGHTCDRNGRPVPGEELAPSTYVSNKIYAPSHSDNIIFRQPATPFRRNTLTIDSRPTNSIKQKSTRFGAFGSKQIVVKRLMPVQNGMAPEVEVKTLQNHFTSIQRPPDSSVEETDQEDDSPKDDDDDESPENCKTSNNVSIDPDLEKDVVDSNNTNHKPEQILANEADSLQVSNLESDIVKPIESNSTAEEEENKKSDNCKEDIIFGDKQATPLEDVPDLSQLIDLPLPSPLPISTLDDSTSDIINTIPPLSPMQIVREGSADPKWLEDNINDFSLSSFLGHLDEISSRDGSENPNISLSESSMDYTRKFAEFAASIESQEKDV